MTTTFADLRLSAIVPSLTNPRKTFDPAALEELATSIKASGVHTPVLVRPLPANRLEDTAYLNPRPTHELIAGERRYLASSMAGADTIPAIVREMTDAQVLEAQIVENLQRDDLSALEEAQGYEVLMQHSDLSADDVASKIGKSRTYVFGRLKLLQLGQDGRDALRQGLIDASKALLLARIPDTTLQVKALKEILRPNHPEGVMSYRMAREFISNNYTLKLDQAIFGTSDPTLKPMPCSGCPNRSGADLDIFSPPGSPEICLLPSCYHDKVQQHRSRQRDQLEQAGHTVIDEREAKEIMPTAVGSLQGYARLDVAADNPAGNGQTLRTELASVLDSGELKPTMLANPHKEGELIACIPDEEVTHWLTKAGRKQSVKAANETMQSQNDARAQKQASDLHVEFEREWRLRTVRQLHGHLADKPMGLALPYDLVHQLAKETLDGLGDADFEALAKMLKLGDIAPKEGVRLWVETAAQGHDWSIHDALTLLLAQRDARFFAGWKPEDQENECLLIAAQDSGIDIEQVKTQVQAEIVEREAQKAAEKQAALDAAQAPLPLPPAAQASGVRGEAKAKKGKGQKTPADAGAGLGRLSAQEARQGIADALQGDEAPDAARRSEAISGADAQGNGVGPASRPDGAADTAAGDVATAAQDASGGVHATADGAAPVLASQARVADRGAGAPVEGGQGPVAIGDRVRITGDDHFTGMTGTINFINKVGMADIALDGKASTYIFGPDEFERVEGGAA